MKLVESKLKCPKCKSQNQVLQEIWKNHWIEWEVINGKFDRQDGYLEMGDPYKVVARCKDCKHVWTTRGALQIDDIIK